VITHFIEASNGFNHGKFMICRLERPEMDIRSALPGYEHNWLWSGRKFKPGMTLVVDLQTGEGAAFEIGRGSLPPAQEASYQLNEKHQIWVCPLYEPLLQWLWERIISTVKIENLPRYVELDAPGAVSGYRRQRGGGEVS
jgi:hypothetical protein